ncbi:lipid-transfer protein [Nocardioides szechwanensis]|uniref:Acetyl-CoA acetyltransferase n=1 Tax=Nocardioides szechwanensis TaxID=1005944 RepID=A0A1G9WM96_9ACTN|nr:thiolase domain-containing protein [Nocardioides szechwanensis]GEP32585.1 lipid-transfer protein [Nocardioides szechwanensis]SDM85620.1 Acetyl-CoA acetyltransferase [Nocardioides szechwanensis]
MRDVAVVGFAQRQMPDFDGSPTCVEMLVPILAEIYEQTGWTRRDVGFWCSGSSDYLAGRSFSFVQAVDAIGVTPPVNESHVEMDLAWAMYEAWIKIQTGEVDTAVVYAFGKSSAGVLRRTLALQLDPYTMTPLWPDTVSLAGLQARAGIDAGLWDERAMAEVANRSLTDAEKNDYSIRKGGSSVEELLARPMYADPLRKHDCSPVTDGAAAIVLAAGDKAYEVRDKPAWISGLSHFVDSPSIGNRDLTRSPSAANAAAKVDLNGVEVAELHAPFSHQELILRRELGLGDDVRINPSGGALTSNPMFSGGGIRIGETAQRIWSGEVAKGVAHATSGAALQQNLLCVLESSTGKDA